MLHGISRIFSGFRTQIMKYYLSLKTLPFILKPLNERCSNVNNNGITNAFQA